MWTERARRQGETSKYSVSSQWHPSHVVPFVVVSSKKTRLFFIAAAFSFLRAFHLNNSIGIDRRLTSNIIWPLQLCLSFSFHTFTFSLLIALLLLLNFPNSFILAPIVFAFNVFVSTPSVLFFIRVWHELEDW